jgi:hypothetical protein
MLLLLSAGTYFGASEPIIPTGIYIYIYYEEGHKAQFFSSEHTGRTKPAP